MEYVSDPFHEQWKKRPLSEYIKPARSNGYGLPVWVIEACDRICADKFLSQGCHIQIYDGLYTNEREIYFARLLALHHWQLARVMHKADLHDLGMCVVPEGPLQETPLTEAVEGWCYFKGVLKLKYDVTLRFDAWTAVNLVDKDQLLHVLHPDVTGPVPINFVEGTLAKIEINE